ncbi:transglycosylase domain-containing protein [Virgibacillus oceani]|uniref:Carboxypeptidase n=1 Tax=Virgibacillus oceani TaxID=1479511 RepID=A0A917HPH4_9BACI|nr:transglycosylase domain-containing protein [Virgibacillus oceani]GGG85070.1 carboxypeptidase [Virgibacillus oceani]
MNDFKQLLHKYGQKLKSLWEAGKIQRTSRISYDVFWNVILFFIIVGVIGFFFAGGIGAGYFASLVKDEPVRTYASMEKDIYNYEETSQLYFAENKYIGNIRSDIHREEIDLKDVSETLINAVIATEDRNFEEHHGVVPKAIIRAVVQEATNAPIKTGGSTLTQQLIKNQILTNEVSFERKAKEILLALRLERFFDKDQILEAYLNIIPYGRDASGQNIAGIQTAAQGIFGIDAKDVNLPQAAYLAGLPQSPSYYTPFVNSGGLKSKEGLQPGINRMKTVLERMYEAEYITKKEYEKARNYDIAADFTEETESPLEKYPYLTVEVEKRAKEIISEKLAKEDGYTLEDLKNDKKLNEEYMILADRDLRQNGYKIHSTIDKKTYDAFQKIAKDYKYYGRDINGEPVQVAGMLIENKTGKIISFVGGRGYDIKDWNYATQAVRPNGSTMKPLLTYAPAFEKGVAQPGTVLPDIKTYYGNGYSPSNYTGNFHGLVSARKALAESFNVPAIYLYNKFKSQDAVSEFLEPMGITSLGEDEYAHLSLGIGGTETGITIEENVNAFTTFANKGKFIDAYMIDKITTKDGDIIYEHESDPVKVFSPQTSYLTLDVLRDVIKYGTATYLQSQMKYPGVDWASKTGTSSDWHDSWFVGINPNVTLGTWIGYDTPKSLKDDSYPLSYSQRNQKIWAQLVNKATEINPELMAPNSKFKRPDGLVTRSYCAISGMLPSDLCKKAGLVTTDLFNAKYVPTKTDDSLIEGTYVMVDGKAVIAGPNTPNEFTKGDGLTFNPEFLKRNGYDRLSDITKLFPSTNRSAWEKISVPSSDIGGAIKDDGKSPGAPTSLSASGNKLTWKKSGSKDVVGYRIYRAAKPGASFSAAGSTTNTSFSIPDGNAVYIVKAVDYFGLESGASKEVKIGDFSKKADKPKQDKPENEKPKKPDKPDKPDSEKTDKPEDNGNDDSA